MTLSPDSYKGRAPSTPHPQNTDLVEVSFVLQTVKEAIGPKSDLLFAQSRKLYALSLPQALNTKACLTSYSKRNSSGFRFNLTSEFYRSWGR